MNIFTVPHLALLAELPLGVVPAVDALPGLGVTRVRVPVTLALDCSISVILNSFKETVQTQCSMRCHLATVGEVPVAGLTFAAPPPESGLGRVAQTLACHYHHHHHHHHYCHLPVSWSQNSFWLP